MMCVRDLSSLLVLRTEYSVVTYKFDIYIEQSTGIFTLVGGLSILGINIRSEP